MPILEIIQHKTLKGDFIDQYPGLTIRVKVQSSLFLILYLLAELEIC